MERVHMFQAMSLLRMLIRYFERTPLQYARQGADWPPLVLLDEARQTLSEL
jgi:hypothetical protein